MATKKSSRNSRKPSRKTKTLKARMNSMRGSKKKK